MNAQQLRNSILQEAIEGRLVPQDPNDEPASVLLARIRKEKERLVKEGKLKKKDLEVKPISEDEIPFEIPESWEWVRFGTITINRDSERVPLSVDERSKLKKTYDYYGASGVIDKVENYLFDKPLLLIGEDGANLINRSTPIAFIAKGKYWVNNHAHVLDYINEGLMQYMCWYINAISLVDYVTGTAQPKMNQEKMNSILVALPPLAEQHRIVAKIEELLPKVEEYGKAQEALDKLNAELPDRLKKCILQEAIEGRLVPQDPNDEPASVLLAKIRKEKEQLVKAGKLKKKDLIETPITDDEIPFEIPESWEWVRLGEISTYANTKKKINAATAAPNLWGLDLEDIEKGGRLLSFKSVGERKAIGDKTCFLEGDILYSKLRPYLLKILVAPKDGICTPEIIPFTCYGDICKEYIVSLLKSSYVDEYINSVTFGVKMPRVSTETMTSLVLPLPPFAEQHRIVKKLEQVLGEIDKLKLETLRDLDLAEQSGMVHTKADGSVEIK